MQFLVKSGRKFAQRGLVPGPESFEELLYCGAHQIKISPPK